MGQPVAVSYSFPLAVVAGEDEEADEHGKGETRLETRRKEADKQETSRAMLGEELVT